KERMQNLSKQGADRLSQAQREQARAKEDLDQSRPDKAAQEQAKAADQLQQAAAELRTGDEKPDSRQKPDPSRQEVPQESAAPAEEGGAADRPASDDASDARKLTIAQILEKERREREMMQKLRRRAAGRARPVDKDW